jgi:hypothetical protein
MLCSSRNVWTGVLILLIAVYFVRPAYIYATSRPDVDQSKCEEGSSTDKRHVKRSGKSDVKVIEVGDLGQFIDRCQYTDAMFELNWDRQLYPPYDFNVDVEDGAVPKPKFVVLYIHGWHNSAREDVGDLPAFRRLIQDLAKTNIDKQVTGIYIGWDANSSIPIWHYLDFWQKKNKADRIAASGIVTKVISSVSNIVSRSKLGGRFVTIGHSFGARILMASTIQSAIVATEKAHPGHPHGEYKVIESLSQTAIFLNPAFEASYFSPIAAYNRFEEKFSQNQKPVLISIATSDDIATQVAFPLGQWIAWKTARNETSTLGNFAPFWTHQLKSSGASSCASGDRLTEAYSHEGTCLERTAGFAGNPFMVVRTDPPILSGHNGIWEPRFAAWLFGYLDALNKQLPPKASTD